MTRNAPSSSREVWSASDLSTDPHEATDKADRVRRMFAAIAPSYDLNNRLHSFGRDQAWRRKAVRLCRVKPTDEVLDVACGTGDLAEAFADAGPASVVGIDFTEPMLEIARAKATRRRRGSRIPLPKYLHGDATQLDVPDRSVDIVSIAFGIRNVTDPAQAVREFRRVLRPGGRLMILEFSRPTNPLVRFVDTLYRTRIMPVTASLLARDRSGAYRYLPKSVETFLDREAMIGTMINAGFEDVTPQPMTFGVCVGYLGHVPDETG